MPFIEIAAPQEKNDCTSPIEVDGEYGGAIDSISCDFAVAAQRLSTPCTLDPMTGRFSCSAPTNLVGQNITLEAIAKNGNIVVDQDSVSINIS